MRKTYKTKDEDLEQFKTEFEYTNLAEDLIDSLFHKFGRETLNRYLVDDEAPYDIHQMNEIKSKIEEEYLTFVCSSNDILHEKIKLYELFPNSNLLIGGMYPDSDILDILIKNEWIEEDKTWQYPNASNWWAVDKTFLFKGCNWEKCPQPIKDHFIKLKEENANSTSNNM